MIYYLRVGAGSIPEAQAGAEGVAAYVVRQQVLAIAVEVLDLDCRVEPAQDRYPNQIESQIGQQADMRAIVADEEFIGHLNFLPGLGIEPGQGGDQIGVPVIVGNVRVRSEE